MASVQEPLRRHPFPSEHRDFSPSMPKSIPILPSASPAGAGDPMEISQSQTATMGPPPSSANGGDKGEQQHQSQQSNDQSANGAPVGAAAAAQQPKVVQTAFIHKLYKYDICLCDDGDPGADCSPVCSKTKAFSTSYLGRVPTRALSCLPRPNSPKS